MRINQNEIEIIANKVFTLGIQHSVVGYDSGVSNKDAITAAVEVVRDELVKAGVPVQRKRKAIVEDVVRNKLHQIQQYLPSNFTACEHARTAVASPCILIEGYDRGGWTLDGYVIPQLASGLIVAKEVKENDELPCRHLDYALTLDGGKCNDCGDVFP